MKAILQLIFDRVARGQATTLLVVFADGTTFRNREGEPDVTIRFKTRSAERRTALLGYVGFFEAYFERDVEIQGRRAIGAIMRMAYTGAYKYTANPLLTAKRKWLEWRDSNRTYAQAKENARRHYGLPHEFFKILLGEDCLYAEGYWPAGTTDLAQAQRQRCDYICRKLRLEPGTKLVEVGSAWGYMAMLAAEKYGAEVVNYGLVPSQNRAMQERLERNGLSGRVRVVERDHRDLCKEPDTYDRYLSIGVYEHAGWNCQRAWIESIATALKPGGIGLISTVGYIKRYPTEFLTIRYVFPGGSVPSLPRTLELLDEYGLHVLDLEELGSHYQRTAEEWLTNFETRWPHIQAIDPDLFTEHFRRVWTYYLSGVIENFRPGGGDLSLHHITFTKGKGHYPGDRSVIYSDAGPS